MLFDIDKKWDTKLPWATFAINTTPQRSLDYRSPMEVMLGIYPRLISTSCEEIPEEQLKAGTRESVISTLMERRAELRHHVRQHRLRLIK